MSSYTGKCDLYDHMIMEDIGDCGDLTPIERELKCFEKFKQRTNGTLYQSFRLELNDFNIDKEIEYRGDPKILSKVEHRTLVKDNRCKGGIREDVTYSYIYFMKEYPSLEALNKKHYYAVREIKFDNILELIPYYLYICSSIASDESGETIYLSKESFLDEKYYSFRRNGIDTSYILQSISELQNHYMDVVKQLLLKEGSNYEK